MRDNKNLDKNKIEKITTEVKVMSKETQVENTKKELSRAEKKAARRAQMSESGRLHLSDEFKEAGYRYRVCNVLPGNIENYKSQGYEVVTHSISSGTGSLATPEVDGVPQEFEVGGANGSMKAVWMRISEDDASILDEIRDDKAKEQAGMIYKSPIPEDSNAANHPLTQHTNIGKISTEKFK